MTDLSKLPAVDPDVPNAARMYDYSLGGSHNVAADHSEQHASADRPAAECFSPGRSRVRST
jgi:hypothetical protein